MQSKPVLPAAAAEVAGEPPNEGELLAHNGQVFGARSALGKAVAAKGAADAEVTAQKEALKTTQYKSYTEKKIAAAEEKARKAAKELEAKTVMEFKVVAEALEKAAPEVAKTESIYKVQFQAEVSGPAEKAAADRAKERLDARRGSLPKPSADGIKAARQPRGRTAAELQEEGPRVMRNVWGVMLRGMHKASLALAGDESLVEIVEGPAAGSRLAVNPKSLDRALEKAHERHGGDPAAVTDYGRATVVGEDMVAVDGMLAAVLEKFDAANITIENIKNRLHPSVDDTASFGFRNISLLVREPDSRHVVEVQFSLANIERIKNSPYGHVVFEVARRAGMVNGTASGNPDDVMVRAIASGQALELDLEDANIEPGFVDDMVGALASPGCRTRKIKCVTMTGGGKLALFVGIARVSTTVVELK